MSAVIESPQAQLRPMREEDIPAILIIERQAYAYPWTEGIFKDCLRVGYACWVLEGEAPGEILAYAIISVAADECHVLNICVDREQQRQGLGRRLLRNVLAYAHDAHAQTAYLEVRPSNTVAVGLYLSEGFNEVGLRKNYYPAKTGREDALILAKVL